MVNPIYNQWLIYSIRYPFLLDVVVRRLQALGVTGRHGPRLSPCGAMAWTIPSGNTSPHLVAGSHRWWDFTMKSGD